MSLPRRALPTAVARRGWCPGLGRPMPTGDGLLARVHPPLGILSLPQARAIAAGARRFGNGHLDLTARANLQIRGVTDSTRAALAHLLEAVGLGDARQDGGPQRLTLTSPLAGRDPAEVIDVPGLARAVEAAGCAIAGLPAKTLIAIEGRPRRALPDADFFVRAFAPGRVGIALAGEDGLLDLGIFSERDAPVVVARLLDAFSLSGKRRARDLSRAERTTLAAEPTAADRAQVPSPGRERDRVRDAISPERPGPSPRPSPARERGQAGASPTGVPSPTPAAGLTSLTPDLSILALDAPFGRCTADALDRLLDAAADLQADEIRLSPMRGFILLVPDRARAMDALAALSADFITTPDDPRRSVAACTGAPACASGTTPTLDDAARIAAILRPLAAQRVSIHVSGCAKGCARPGPADLTLVGMDGRYGASVAGSPGDPPGMRLTIEAALERLGRAGTIGLAAAFAPDDGPRCGRDRNPA